jgi:hypothetical protein
MKPPLSTSLLTITFLLLTVLIPSGCKQKGCTDKNALNYDNAAVENDGSCIYCETQVTTLLYFRTDIYDNNSNSQYYNVEIVSAAFSSDNLSYNYKTCGTDTCRAYLTMENFINKTIDFDCEIHLDSPMYYTYTTHITIPPNSTLNLGEINSVQSPINCGAPSGYIALRDTITYH